MEKEAECIWCKKCISKTKQEMVFMPEIPTYKRRRQYKCTQCGQIAWLQGRRPQLNQFTNKIAINFLNFMKKFVDTISSFSVTFLSVTIEKQVKCKTCQW